MHNANQSLIILKKGFIEISYVGAYSLLPRQNLDFYTIKGVTCGNQTLFFQTRNTNFNLKC